MEQTTQLKKTDQHEPKIKHGEGADQNCHPEPNTNCQKTGTKKLSISFALTLHNMLNSL